MRRFDILTINKTVNCSAWYWNCTRPLSLLSAVWHLTLTWELVRNERLVMKRVDCDGRWKWRTSRYFRTSPAWRRSLTVTQPLNCWSSRSVTFTFRRSAAIIPRSRELRCTRLHVLRGGPEKWQSNRKNYRYCHRYPSSIRVFSFVRCIVIAVFVIWRHHS